MHNVFVFFGEWCRGGRSLAGCGLLEELLDVLGHLFGFGWTGIEVFDVTASIDEVASGDAHDPAKNGGAFGKWLAFDDHGVGDLKLAHKWLEKDVCLWLKGHTYHVQAFFMVLFVELLEERDGEDFATRTRCRKEVQNHDFAIKVAKVEFCTIGFEQFHLVKLCGVGVGFGLDFRCRRAATQQQAQANQTENHECSSSGVETRSIHSFSTYLSSMTCVPRGALKRK